MLRAEPRDVYTYISGYSAPLEELKSRFYCFWFLVIQESRYLRLPELLVKVIVPTGKALLSFRTLDTMVEKHTNYVQSPPEHLTEPQHEAWPSLYVPLLPGIQQRLAGHG